MNDKTTAPELQPERPPNQPTFAEFITAVFGDCIDHHHEQVGRCVYCNDCDRRMYEGQVMSAAELEAVREAIRSPEDQTR